MNKAVLIIATLVLSACSVPSTQPQEIDATQDLIATAELAEVSNIRLQGQLSFDYVNDRFVTVPARGETYLVEFSRDCRSLSDTTIRQMGPDRRGSSLNLNLLRAGTDTIHGCRIKKIYEITEAQKEELHALGDSLRGEEPATNEK
jgi:hypothetical protein